MTEREERDLARRLADGSRVFDFERALEFVRYSPAAAAEMISDREEALRMSEEIACHQERRRRARIEDFG